MTSTDLFTTEWTLLAPHVGDQDRDCKRSSGWKIRPAKRLILSPVESSDPGPH